MKKRRLRYLVHISKDPDSDWGVPDLPGCVATGKTIDAVLRRIQKAIAIHLQGLREDGLRIPRPRQRTVVPRWTASRVDFYATVEVAAKSRRGRLLRTRRDTPWIDPRTRFGVATLRGATTGRSWSTG